jgi:hypothetical protein
MENNTKNVHVFPEYQQAYRLQCAFYTLCQYFKQATRGRDLQVFQYLAAAFETSRPISQLFPLGPAEMAEETPEKAARRRAHWRDTLRPILTPGLLKLVVRADITEHHISHPTAYTRAMRDKALDALKGAVDYWDAVYPAQ